MNGQLKLLIVEDSKLAAEAILRSLREAGVGVAEWLVVETPGALVEALSRPSWDVVISDYVMPAFNGAQALALFQQSKLDIPFICVSGEIGDEKAAEIVRSGASNFVSKAHLSRLGKVVQNELSAAAERRQRRHVAELTAHLAAIVEGTDDAILSKDMKGVVLSWNSAAERMYGFTAEEAIGKPLTSLTVPPERKTEFQGILEELRLGNRIRRMETIRRHKNGKVIHVSLTISPVRNAQGEVIGGSVIGRDISQRVHLERERDKLIEELQAALAKVKQLSGLLPICASCKRIRNGQDEWQAVEVYIHEHSQADFTHGICPECTQKLYPEYYDRLKKR